jgi:SAM-dependent methyltransferase
MTNTIVQKLSQFLKIRPAPPAIEWGTKSDATRLGVEHRTRYWAHAWVRERMSRLPLHKMSVVDAGSGTSNPLLDWYRPKVKYAYLLDLSPPSQGDNWELINCDLERPLPFRDEFVDLITSVSSIEHLSAAGQLLFMSEAQRILKPNGSLIMTVSYTCGLTPHALALIASDPVFEATGCSLKGKVNLKEMFDRAPLLADGIRADSFPGFAAFSEEWLLLQPDIIFDYVGSYGNVRCLPEVDALRLPWAEIALHFTKTH